MYSIGPTCSAIRCNHIKYLHIRSMSFRQFFFLCRTRTGFSFPVGAPASLKSNAQLKRQSPIGTFTVYYIMIISRCCLALNSRCLHEWERKRTYNVSKSNREHRSKGRKTIGEKREVEITTWKHIKRRKIRTDSTEEQWSFVGKGTATNGIKLSVTWNYKQIFFQFARLII